MKRNRSSNGPFLSAPMSRASQAPKHWVFFTVCDFSCSCQLVSEKSRAQIAHNSTGMEMAPPSISPHASIHRETLREKEKKNPAL